MRLNHDSPKHVPLSRYYSSRHVCFSNRWRWTWYSWIHIVLSQRRSTNHSIWLTTRISNHQRRYHQHYLLWRYQCSLKLRTIETILIHCLNLRFKSKYNFSHQLQKIQFSIKQICYQIFIYSIYDCTLIYYFSHLKYLV